MSRKKNNFYLESLVRTNKDLCVPLSEWQILYYCTKEIYNTFKGCMRNMFKRSACLPARYPCSWRTETVVLSTKRASNEVTELWVHDFMTDYICPGALWKRMRTLHPQLGHRCLVVNKIPQMMRCRVPIIYLTRKRRKSQAEGGNCCSAFRMWLLQNMVSWCWDL